MEFSNTTDKNGIIQRVERYSNLGDGAISGNTTLLKQVTSDVNETIYDIVIQILLSQDNFDWDDVNHTDYPIGTDSLVAGQRDYTFAAALGFLQIKRLDITYNGSDYYRATPVDSGAFDFGLGNTTDEDGQFNKTSPVFDPKANGFWLYPTASAADVTAGAEFRVEFTREFDEFTSADTTQEPAIDRPFHELIAIGAALKWAVIKDAKKARNLKTLYDEGMQNLRDYYGNRNKDFQLIVNPKIPNYD
jgi:hypothetical protein